jgi:hypothetical protein
MRGVVVGFGSEEKKTRRAICTWKTYSEPCKTRWIMPSFLGEVLMLRTVLCRAVAYTTAGWSVHELIIRACHQSNGLSPRTRDYTTLL